MGQRRGFLVWIYFGFGYPPASAGVDNRTDRQMSLAPALDAHARDTGTPLAAGCRERAPAGVAIRLGSEVGRVSPWHHGEGRWARASSPPRAWQPPHPVGRERGTRAERSAMARGRVFASTARVFGPSARPETPTARVSGGARGAKVLSFGEICTRRWCRGNGRGWARTAARTRKATRDCFWDLAESFLLALERGINGRKSAHGRPDRTRQRLERPIGKLLPQAMEKTVQEHHRATRKPRGVARAGTHLVTAARAARAGVAQVKEAMTAC